MLNHHLDRAEWGAFFDGLSRHVADTPSYATARVFTIRPGEVEGEQEEAWRRLVGVTWEPREDTITVALDGLDHRIERPNDVWADEPTPRLVRRFVVVGPGGRRDEIELRSADLMEGALADR